ncbi:MAG: hypothetical protein FWD35_02705 [Oscillospiraceae bacterium]|nr:hypothetical protein [Oscillospiraceae bacterium]
MNLPLDLPLGLSKSLSKDFLQNLLKDPDNVLILALLLILWKEKADKSLLIALLAILLIE